MSTSSTCDLPLLDDGRAIARLRRAVATRDPFSFIRLGDGEAVVLSFDDDIWLQDLAYLHGHWGPAKVSLADVAKVRDDLKRAVRRADLVGVRNDVVDVSVPDGLLQMSGRELRDVVCERFHLREGEMENLSEIGARRIALLHHSLGRTTWADSQEFCSAWLHWELLSSGALAEILRDVDEVGLVTARPELDHLVAEEFAVTTTTVMVPDKFVEGATSGAHVPDRYATIRSDLRFPPGTLVLVGAGIPGKIYCDWLKEQGCVAIDIGAVLDMWVGKASRPRVLETRFDVADGRVPPELRLRSSMTPATSGLQPRWKPVRVPS